MFRNVSLSKTKLAIVLPLFLFAFLATLSFISPKHAAAAAPQCGVQTGNAHDYAGLVVELRWHYTGDPNYGKVDNTDVKVETVGTATPGGNVVHLAGDHTTIINREYSETFKQINSSCGDGHNVVLGYGDGNTANRTSSPGGATNDGTVWALDCDISVHPTYYERFRVSAAGLPKGPDVPSNLPTNGTWDTKVTSASLTDPGNSAANGQSAFVTLTYTVDPPTSHKPAVTGTFSCSSNTVIGKATDDDPGTNPELRVNIYLDGNFKNSQTTNNHYYSYAFGANEIQKGRTYTILVVAKGVDFTGHQDDLDNSKSISINCPPGGGGGGGGGIPTSPPGCPTMPEGWQSVTVPDRDGIPYDDAIVTKQPEEGKGTVLYKRLPTGNGGTMWEHAVNSVRDQWGETDGAWLPWGYTTNSTFQIDYTPFMRAYPYDYHNITVNYTTKYNEVAFIYDVQGEAYCDTGQTLDSGSCFHTYENPNSHVDSKGNVIWATSNGPDQCFGHLCSHNDGPAKHYWYPEDISQHQTTKTVTMDYSNTPQLDACYPRTYEIDNGATQAGNVTLGPTYENPNSVTFSYNLGIRYGFSPVQSDYYQPYDNPGSPPVRAPLKANLYYTAHYSVLHANGSEVPIGSKSDTAPMPNSWYTGGPVNLPLSDGVNISVPPYVAGDEFCVYVDVWSHNGEMNNDGGDPIDHGGEIIGQNGTGEIVTTNKSCSAPIVNQPYANFLGSDVSAGAGFGDSCTTSSGRISMYGATVGTLPRGSGSQFATLAQGDIEGASSATLRNAVPAGSTGLSFSNIGTNGSTPAANLGGRLGLSNFCVPDYYSKKPASLTTPNTSTSAPIGTAGTQYYKPAGGTLTITGGTVGVGVKQAIFVDGNVYINGNIGFDGATAGWAHLSDVPSLYIVVKNGNVLIDPNVRQLDGVYVAQPNGNSNGIINTCATATYQFSAAYIFDSCKNQLTVNGAFVARQVFLNRSFSSLRYSASGESPLYGALHGCGTLGSDIPVTGPAVSKDCGAEVFNFSPELYLAQPAITPSTGPTTGKYDSVTSLSPVL